MPPKKAPAEPTPSAFMKVAETAAVLQVTRSTVYRYFALGVLTPVRLNPKQARSAVRVRRSEVEAMLDGNGKKAS